MLQYSQIINAPIQIVWEHFIFKIDNPQHFVPGVSNVVIKEKNNEYVIRQMDIQVPDTNKVTVLEKITHAPYHVKFEIVDHPVYTGYVDNFAEAISEVETKITFAMHWKNKTTLEDFTNQNLIKEAVIKTIDYISKQ